MSRELGALPASDPEVAATKKAAIEGVGQLSEAAQALGDALKTAPDRAQAVAVPFLKLCGLVIGGWLMAKSASIAAGKLTGADKDFYAAKLRTARFYADQVLPAALGHARIVASGAGSVTETDAARL
jgi:butyryl-CoA dehydrogenase